MKNLSTLSLFSVLFLLFGFVNVSAQTGTFTSSEGLKAKNNIVYVSPTALLDVVNPAIQLGYERLLSAKLSVRGDIGIIIPHSLPGLIWGVYSDGHRHASKVDSLDSRTRYNTYSGYKLKLEVKYWLQEIRGRKGAAPYVALGLFYTHNNYKKIDDFEKADTTFAYSADAISKTGHSKEYAESFRVDKIRFGADVKFGLQIYSRSFTLSLSSGIGIVYRKVSYHDLENILDKRITNSSGIFDIDREGNDWLLNIPMDVSLGFRF